jgi:hypothetical protein
MTRRNAVFAANQLPPGGLVRLFESLGGIATGLGVGQDRGVGAEFADDLVQRLAVSNGAVDELQIDVIFEENFLGRSGFLGLPAGEVRGAALEQPEDLGRYLDYVNSHTRLLFVSTF